MQRLNTTLAPIWTAAYRHQSEDDKQTHLERTADLRRQVMDEVLQPIPAPLHDAGDVQIRKVSPETIARLQQGYDLALATRRLLPKGPSNQRLAMAASRGANWPNIIGIRTIALPDQTERKSTAALGVLGRAGQCAEHTAVTFELALELDLSVAIVANDDDHQVVMLSPELRQQGVVVDAWTTFPSSCLRADSEFTRATVVQRHVAGDSRPPSTFNLVTLDAIRCGLEQQLGPEPIERAGLADFIEGNQRVQTRLAQSTASDQAQAGNSPLPVADLYFSAANAVGTTAIRSIKVASADPNVNQELSDIATVRTAAQMEALRKSSFQAACASPLRTASREETWSNLLTAANGTRARVDVTLSSKALPILRDVRLASKNIRYLADDGSEFLTTRAPQDLINDAAEALAEAQRMDFPAAYVTAPRTARSPAQIVATALARIEQASGQPSMPDALAAQVNELQAIKTHMAQLSSGEQDEALVRFSTLLPELPAGLIEQAATVWKPLWKAAAPGPAQTSATRAVLAGWARHFTDTQIEPTLREALGMQRQPLRLVGGLVRHVLSQQDALVQRQALTLIDQQLPAIAAGVRRSALMVDAGAMARQITDVQVREDALAMLRRHA